MTAQSATAMQPVERRPYLFVKVPSIYSNNSTRFTARSLDRAFEFFNGNGQERDMNWTTGFAPKPNFYILSTWR